MLARQPVVLPYLQLVSFVGMCRSWLPLFIYFPHSPCSPSLYPLSTSLLRSQSIFFTSLFSPAMLFRNYVSTFSNRRINFFSSMKQQGPPHISPRVFACACVRARVCVRRCVQGHLGSPGRLQWPHFTMLIVKG